MKKYVKTFDEYINEALSKTKGDLKVDELWDLANRNQKEFEKLMKEYLETLDVAEFCKYFGDIVIEELTEKLEELVIDDTDEDGYHSVSVEGTINSYECVFEDDEQFGEYGISIYYDGNEFNSSAFCGEMDLKDTKLGDTLKEIFFKSYDIAEKKATNNWTASKEEYKSLEDTYRSIAQSNGWSY